MRNDTGYLLQRTYTRTHSQAPREDSREQRPGGFKGNIYERKHFERNQLGLGGGIPVPGSYTAVGGAGVKIVVYYGLSNFVICVVDTVEFLTC